MNRDVPSAPPPAPPLRTPEPPGVRGVSRLMMLGAATFGWVALASAHEATLPTEQRGPLFQHYMKRWAHSLVRSTGGKVYLTEGSVVPPHVGPRIVVANHRSPFDIGILLSLFGGHAVSRADLSNWPILGLAARRAGTIFVDRDKAESGAAAIRAIRRRLQAGASILVFPEGGTFEGDEVRPFKPGAFTALRGLNAQIVPVGLAYDPGAEWVNEGFVQHVVRVTNRPRTRCVVAIGSPVAAHGKAQQLASSLHGSVQRLVHLAREDWQHRFAST